MINRRILCIILMLFLIPSVTAKPEYTYLKLPNEYKNSMIDGECDLAAHDFQKEFGGGIVFLEPNTYEDGVQGHYLNKVIISGKIYFVDWINQRIFSNKSEVLSWYVDAGKKSGYFTDAVFLDTEENKKAIV